MLFPQLVNTLVAVTAYNAASKNNSFLLEVVDPFGIDNQPSKTVSITL